MSQEKIGGGGGNHRRRRVEKEALDTLVREEILGLNRKEFAFFFFLFQKKINRSVTS